MFAVLSAVAVTRPALAQTNFDRPGGDYLNAPVTSGDPARAAANVGKGGLAFALRLASNASDEVFGELDEMDDGTHFCWDPSVVR